MTNALLILAIILLYTLQSFLCRKYTDHYPGKAHMASPVFTAVSGATVVAVCFAVSGFSFKASGLTVLLGFANALTLLGYNYFIVKASQTGAHSVMMVLSITGCITVSALTAHFAFGDELSIFKLLALLGVFLSVYLISHRKGERLAAGKAFIPACIGLGLCNGAYNALLDVQQRLSGTEEKEELVAITYGVAVLVSLLQMLLREKKELPRAFRQSRLSLSFLLICSLITAFAINVLVYVLPLVDVTLLYTFQNAGVMLLSVLASCVFLKERLSPVNIVGGVLMCGSLVMVSIF